jgi:hypothetical protein
MVVVEETADKLISHVFIVWEYSRQLRQLRQLIWVRLFWNK